MSAKQFPPLPSMSLSLTELADCIECRCLFEGSVSRADVVAALSPLADFEEDAASDDEAATSQVDAAFEELAIRASHCGDNDGRYPFKVADRGETVSYLGLGANLIGMTYVSMLMATLLNMQSDRTHAEVDGTRLFESLCQQVTVRYLGGPAEQVDSLVFGTARFSETEEGPTGFAAMVNELCHQLGEGAVFRKRSTTLRVKAKDDKLDVVAWRSFADRRAGKLIVFGQCKTGNHWEQNLCDLQPIAFCDKWMSHNPVVRPLRLFFVAERLSDEDWETRSIDAGIIFDRCRIVEYSLLKELLPKELLMRIRKWVLAVGKATGLRLT